MSDAPDFCMSELPDFCAPGLLSCCALGEAPVVPRFMSDFEPSLERPALSFVDGALRSLDWPDVFRSSWPPFGACWALAPGGCWDCAFCAVARAGPARRAATAADASNTFLMGGSSWLLQCRPPLSASNQPRSLSRVPVWPAHPSG